MQALVAIAAGIAVLFLATGNRANASTSPGTGGAGIPASPEVTPPAGETLDSETVYELIQSGQISKAMAGKASRWFTWREVFISGELANTSAKKRVSRSQLANAQRHAKNLDRVRDEVGEAMTPISWIRLSSGTSHGNGSGTDFSGDRAKHDRIFNAAIRVGWIGGIGKSTGNASARLHLDSWQGVAARPAGQLVPWEYYNNAGDWRSVSVEKLKSSVRTA